MVGALVFLPALTYVFKVGGNGTASAQDAPDAS
jgi:hypothetical protein